MVTDAKADVTRRLIDVCLSVSRETAVAEEERYDQNAQIQCT